MSSSPYLQHRATFQPLAMPEKRGVHASSYILSWIFFSNITILFNKWLIDTAGFRYPILLTTWHLLFATLATQLLARTTTLLNSRHTLRLNGRIYLRTILPIGVLYSGSLICSNVVYLYLSVAFIQMLKAASPVVVLLTSWIWGVADPSASTFLNVLVIVLGVGLASFGEIEFSWIGFLYQWGGIIFEAIRLVMVQVMLSADEMGMDPLVGLYYYAPVCTIMNLFVAMVVEFRYFQWQDVVDTGFGMLFLNALIAFMLNVASVFLIGKTSGLVMTLTSIFKNTLLVILSVVIWHTKITELQIIGYATALAGLLYYSVGKDQLLRLWYGTPSYPLEKRDLEAAHQEPSNTWFRVAVFTLLGFFSVVLVVSFLQDQGYSGKDFLRLTTTWFGSS